MENIDYKKRIIANLKDDIKLDVNSGIEKTVSHYLDAGLKHLKHSIQMVNKWERHKPWSSEDRNMVAHLWLEMEPDVLTAIERHLQEFKQKRMVKEIQTISAKFAIKEAMNEAGLKYQFIGQVHRAKILVLITKNRSLTVYIPYKKLLEQLPRVIESLKVIRQELEVLGNNVSINKAYNTFDWE